MNVTQLKYLRAVISEGSFAGASRALFVSPQAVSKAIKALEEELQFPLFMHRGRGIVPTETAARFAEQAEDAVRAFDDLVEFARGCQNAEDGACDIHLGIAEAALRCQVFLPEDFSPFRATHQRINLRLVFLGNEACTAALRSGMLDAAIVLGTIDERGLESHRIGTLHARAVMASTHELAHRSSLIFDDLDGRPIALPIDRRCILPQLTRQCRLRRIMPRFEDLALSREAGERFVQEGGIILVARENRFSPLPPGVALLPFDEGESFTIPLSLVYPSDRSDAVARLYAYVATMARRTLGRMAEIVR